MNSKTPGDQYIKAESQNSLAKNSSRILGIIVPRLNSHFMSSTISGIEEIAHQRGYNLIISQSLESMQNEIRNARAMLESRVDGLMVSLAYDNDDLSHFDPFLRNKVPLVFFDRVAYHQYSTNVVINNFHAGFEAVSHLLEQGCRRIVHITGNLKQNVYRDRLRGHKEALSSFGLSFKDAHLITNGLTSEEGQKVADQILQMSPLPDGLFFANDVCAIASMSALKQQGIAIPSDMAIVGFNNDPITSYVNPKLTTVNYRGMEMGKVIGRNLMNHLKGKNEMAVPGTIILNAELIIRESSLRTSG